MSKRRQQPLRATSIEVIDLFRGGMKQQDIADKMGMKYPRVAGIIWRARKRGDMDSRRDSMSPEKQLEAQLRRPPMLMVLVLQSMGLELRLLMFLLLMTSTLIKT